MPIVLNDLFTVTCYRSLGSGLSVPDVWCRCGDRHAAEYHARDGRRVESRSAGCYHGPFRIIHDRTNKES
jgi:hypothetical protein